MQKLWGEDVHDMFEEQQKPRWLEFFEQGSGDIEDEVFKSRE